MIRLALRWKDFTSMVGFSTLAVGKVMFRIPRSMKRTLWQRTIGVTSHSVTTKARIDRGARLVVQSLVVAHTTNQSVFWFGLYKLKLSSIYYVLSQGESCDIMLVQFCPRVAAPCHRNAMQKLQPFSRKVKRKTMRCLSLFQIEHC